MEEVTLAAPEHGARGDGLDGSLGVWVLAAPWQLGTLSTLTMLNGVVVGVALVALNVPTGTVREQYGFWQEYFV